MLPAVCMKFERPDEKGGERRLQVDVNAKLNGLL